MSNEIQEVSSEFETINLANKDISNNFCKKSLIDFETIKDMLGLSILVYNFNIDIKANMCDETKRYDLNNLKIDKTSVNSQRCNILNSILSKSPNCELYKFYDLKSGSQVGVTVSHKQERLCFIFRGSNELLDWIHDFLICKKELSNGTYVHSGFYKSLFLCDLYYKLRDDLLKLINEYPNYHIYVSGHSLGGGLATLFSYFISDVTSKNITLVTFASPRVGCEKWAKDFNSKTNLRHYRIVNKRDIVTAIPYLYFYHVGNCIHLNNKLEYFIYDIYKDFQNALKYFNPLDHLIENYYNNLLKFEWNEESPLCNYKKHLDKFPSYPSYENKVIDLI